jgi:hypothetical protein
MKVSQQLHTSRREIEASNAVSRRDLSQWPHCSGELDCRSVAPTTTKFREDGVYPGMNCCISSASSISQSLASKYALRKINSVR